MNFTWCEDFLALAASGNFSRAAEARHTSQPAFSRRIRALEEWLGVELFDRTSQPARLTEAGEWFRGVAQDMVARIARLPGEAQAVAEANSAALRIASTTRCRSPSCRAGCAVWRRSPRSGRCS